MVQGKSKPRKKVVSLLPSATEIVNSLGCGDWLVGRSHECDYPPGVSALPVCTAPRLDLGGTSADIDRKVKDAVRDAAAVYQVLDDVLKDLAPDVIITQDQCKVCAVSLADVEAAVCAWTGQSTKMLSLKPMTLSDVIGDIGRVADALGVHDDGARGQAALRARADALTVKPQGTRPRVACIEWTDPLMAAGNWVPELVDIAGGADIFGRPGDHPPWITWGDLKAADPDIVVFMPCGFGLERTAAEARAMIDRFPDVAQMTAAKLGRVYATDGNAYFNRPGPRLVDSIEILRRIISDDRMHPGSIQIPV
ncbi:MAG: ABC transporter substrate-binding protein [Rhodospirillaceae bacterium]